MVHMSAAHPHHVLVRTIRTDFFRWPGATSKHPRSWVAAISLWGLRSCPWKGKDHLVDVESGWEQTGVSAHWVVIHGFGNADVGSKWDLSFGNYIAASRPWFASHLYFHCTYCASASVSHPVLRIKPNAHHMYAWAIYSYMRQQLQRYKSMFISKA